MGKMIFETAINFADMFMAVSFITLYLGSKYSGKKGIILFITFWLIGVAELTAMNYITFFESYGTYLYILFYFVYSCVCLKGNILFKLWMSIITQIIPTIIAVVMNLGICYIIGYDPNKMITVFNSIRVVSVILCKIVLLLCYWIILKNGYKNSMKSSLWYALIIIPLFSVLSVTRLMSVSLKYEEARREILISMICIVAANILTYYFYMVISREYDNKLKVKLLEQQYERAKNSMEEADVFVRQMRSVKHDMKNHLITINGYIESGYTDKAKNYIINLLDNHLPMLQNFISTDNAAFDAIVNSKIAICNAKKIFCQIQVMNGVLSNLDEVDCGVLFGNLFDNAIEASEKSKERRITINVHTKGEYLSVLISNSIDKSVLKDNEELATSKSDKELHGIGIKTVKALVKKYDGMINFFEEEGEFCCHILLDNKKMQRRSVNEN